MTHLDRHPDGGLPDLLATGARGASDGRLASAFAGGIIAAIVIAVWRPAGWIPLTGLALWVAAFGAWGVADRELLERSTGTTAMIGVLRVARLVAAAVGVLAAMVVLFALLSATLGIWIS